MNAAVGSSLPGTATAAVSVIICTRNGWSRGFLEATLQSLLAQSLPAREIVLVDDGSTDGTVTQVQRTYPDVTIMPNAGTGLAAARNTGIAAARCPWVAFIDDDDLWVPDKLAEQLAQADACATPDSFIWVSRYAMLTVEDGRPMVMATPSQFASWPACLLASPIQPSGVLISKKLLARIGPFREQIREGAAYDYWIRCLSQGIGIRYSDNVLLHYRQHHPQMTAMERRIDHFLAIDALVAPYLAQLPATLAHRIGTARLLNNLRSLLVDKGTSAAAYYCRRSVLRRVPGPRTIVYFLLDSLFCRFPHGMRRKLRHGAMRLLTGQAIT